MNDTRKNEDQTKEELLKEHELSMEDLDEISGGMDQVCTFKYKCFIGSLFYNGCQIKEDGGCPNGYT